MTLHAKNALVTGTSRGIGPAICDSFATHGARVVCHARREDDARRTAERVGGVPVWGDLSTPEGVREVADRAAHAAPELHVLVHNAGILLRGGIENVEWDDLIENVTVNAVAPALLTRHLLGPLRAAGSARIVVLSSRMGQFAEGMSGGSLPYRASKAAVNAFTANTASELRPDGILVNAMHPGWVRTAMGGSRASVAPEAAADTALYLATLPDDGPTGRFFQDRREIPW